jgi:hypothetical protein
VIAGHIDQGWAIRGGADGVATAIERLPEQVAADPTEVISVQQIADPVLAHLEDPVACDHGRPDTAEVEVDQVQMPPVGGGEEVP